MLRSMNDRGPSRIDWTSASEADKRSVLARPSTVDADPIREGVSAILRQVREEGDRAVAYLTERYDGVALDRIEVSDAEQEAAVRQVGQRFRAAVERAAANIDALHRLQLPRALEVEISPGLTCARRYRPIRCIGLYAPGGTAPLPSTVLMLGVPARIAGCPTRILCTPPRRDGSVDPHVLFAARACGLERIFKIGGAQAIAAMAFGTETVPKVDKIFGPGNAWVTEAKAQVSQDPRGAGHDIPAGPSELLVIADARANPGFVAADLLSQAEHGVDSQVIAISPSRALLDAVDRELEAQLATLPRREIAAVALRSSVLISVRDLEQALDISNAYAPEHLILHVENPRALVASIESAGSVFIGPWTPEAVGDYASGTNHVLPTYGWARAMGGVGVESFMKATSFQELDAAALVAIAPVVDALAEVERLDGHRRAVQLRLDALEATGTKGQTP